MDALKYLSDFKKNDAMQKQQDFNQPKYSQPAPSYQAAPTFGQVPSQRNYEGGQPVPPPMRQIPSLPPKRP